MLNVQTPGASGGNLEVVKFLLEKGADPKAKSKEGKTALDAAREANSAEVVKFLAQLE
ncbi:MAG TPA: ankyrin repeat domain-containing protein [Candidatus Obscuribacterales bacterium]